MVIILPHVTLRDKADICICREIWDTYRELHKNFLTTHHFTDEFAGSPDTESTSD